MLPIRQLRPRLLCVAASSTSEFFGATFAMSGPDDPAIGQTLNRHRSFWSSSKIEIEASIRWRLVNRHLQWQETRAPLISEGRASARAIL
jgi:hypothetical protein